MREIVDRLLENHKISNVKLLERTDPTTGLMICVSLLNTITGKDFSRYLSKHPQMCKDGKIRNMPDYCLHHISGDHNSLDIYDICIIKVSDHNYLSRGSKDLEDCEYISIKNYLNSFMKDISDEII